jgi:hypothetical protein
MAEMWICGDCRSANSPKDKRCYRCRMPRATAEMDEATASMTAASAEATTTVLAAATRLGARYRTTWPLAALTGALILASTAIEVIQNRISLTLVRPDGSVAMDPPHEQTLLTLGIAHLVCFILAGLGWSLWIAVVVSNVPALTARWPNRSPAGAFFAGWIPIISLKRPYSVVREVVTILSDAAFGPALLVIGWWITWLTYQYGPFVVMFLRALGGDDLTVGDLTSSGVWSGIIFEIVAAILAALVLVTVEYFQRVALDRRSQVVLGPESGGT